MAALLSTVLNTGPVPGGRVGRDVWSPTDGCVDTDGYTHTHAHAYKQRALQRDQKTECDSDLSVIKTDRQRHLCWVGEWRKWSEEEKICSFVFLNYHD